MTQTLKYCYPGCTLSYDLATCQDGIWHLTICSADRVVDYICKLCENACGTYLSYGSGSMLPLTDKMGNRIARWSDATADDLRHAEELRNKMEEVKEVSEVKEVPEVTANVNPEPSIMNPEPQVNPEPLTIKHEPQVNPEPLTINHEPKGYLLRNSSTKKKKQPANVPQPSTNGQQPMVNLLKLIGSFAAMSVGLVIIYETGLWIPVGIIGLMAGGLLK